MCHGGAIIAQAVFGILELPADDIDERVESNNDAWLESIQIVHCHHSGFHVPLVVLDHLVVGLDVRQRHIILAEHIPV